MPFHHQRGPAGFVCLAGHQLHVLIQQTPIGVRRHSDLVGASRSHVRLARVNKTEFLPFGMRCIPCAAIEARVPILTLLTQGPGRRQLCGVRRALFPAPWRQPHADPTPSRYVSCMVIGASLYKLTQPPPRGGSCPPCPAVERPAAAPERAVAGLGRSTGHKAPPGFDPFTEGVPARGRRTARNPA